MQSLEDDQIQLDLEGRAKARVGRNVLKVNARNYRHAASNYAREVGVLKAELGFSFGMCGWFYNLKEIFMNEAGGVAGKCSQAFKEAFMLRDVHGQLRTTCTCTGLGASA